MPIVDVYVGTTKLHQIKSCQISSKEVIIGLLYQVYKNLKDALYYLP
jgi:hypothetical protein